MASILDGIEEGMTVRDAGGAEIGTVDYVHFGDDGAATVSEAVRRPSGGIDGIVDFFRTDDVPEPLHDRLLRQGFVRVDSKGLFAADRYVMADQIAAVSADGVVLAVAKDALARREA